MNHCRISNKKCQILLTVLQVPLYIRFLPSIVAEENANKNGHIQNVCSMCIKINKVGKQEVGI